MRRGKKQSRAPGLEKSTRGLSDSRRDAMNFARIKIEHIDLVEWVPLFPLALKNDALPFAIKIAFAAAFPLVDELARIADEARLQCHVTGKNPGDVSGEQKKKEKQQAQKVEISS